MNENPENPPQSTQLKAKGILSKKGVKISRKENIDELSGRGYGTPEKTELLLAFYEALYLVDKGMLVADDKKTGEISFQELLKRYEAVDENAWAKFLAYRDLRSRGYVVREGFGLGVDFRVYDRGDFNKDSAKYLMLSIQEGKPVSLQDLKNVLRQSQSLKKELILAVMNRRGEVVYYSVSQLHLDQ